MNIYTITPEFDTDGKTILYHSIFVQADCGRMFEGMKVGGLLTISNPLMVTLFPIGVHAIGNALRAIALYQEICEPAATVSFKEEVLK